MCSNHTHSQDSPVSKPPLHFAKLGKMFFLSEQDIMEEKDIFLKFEVIKSYSNWIHKVVVDEVLSWICTR